jgi:hypothetical protein
MEHSPQVRKDSFIELMDYPTVSFPEYDAAAQQSSDLLMVIEEKTQGSSDAESTSSSGKSELEIELPKAIKRNKKRVRPVLAKICEVQMVTVSAPKQIGLISIEARQAKIKRFLEKRSRRCWSRKVSYDCRKRVADSRLRVKGRFVAKHLLVPDTDPVPESSAKPVLAGSQELDLSDLLIGS